MEFRDLKTQYKILKNDIDKAVLEVMQDGRFIMGKDVTALEEELAAYVGLSGCVGFK